MLSQLFGYAAALIALIAAIPYIRDIFKGTTKPERASWFIWLVLAAIAFFSQLASGASHSLWLVAAQTLAVVIITLLSIKYGVGGFKRRDIIGLFLAAAGLLLWYTTGEPATALYIIIGVDAIGTTLSAIKSYEQPHTETLSTWVGNSVAGALAIFSVSPPGIILLSYPIYIFLGNLVVSTIIISRRKKVA